MKKHEIYPHIDLFEANIKGNTLYDANLRDCNLYKADLSYVKEYVNMTKFEPLGFDMYREPLQTTAQQMQVPYWVSVTMIIVGSTLLSFGLIMLIINTIFIRGL